MSRWSGSRPRRSSTRTGSKSAAGSDTAKFALTSLGRDRPGIVAGITAPLAAAGISIEDSQMAILGGHFAMVLILEVPREADVREVGSRLEGVRLELGLEAVMLSEIETLEPEAATPTHVVTVYGADHVGIVHAVGEALAERAINITDLSTRVLVGDEDKPLYVMLLEVAAGDETELAQALDAVKANQGVECSFRPLESDAL